MYNNRSIVDELMTETVRCELLGLQDIPDTVWLF